ncbi:hypothetical protein ABC974_09130, partial [Sphingomonas oligophenolica]
AISKPIVLTSLTDASYQVLNNTSLVHRYRRGASTPSVTRCFTGNDFSPAVMLDFADNFPVYCQQLAGDLAVIE